MRLPSAAVGTMPSVDGTSSAVPYEQIAVLNKRMSSALRWVPLPRLRRGDAPYKSNLNGVCYFCLDIINKTSYRELVIIPAYSYLTVTAD